MALLRVAAETIASRMLPGLKVRVAMIGFDERGDVVMDLRGEDVPEGAAELTAEIHQTQNHDRRAVDERVTLRPR